MELELIIIGADGSIRTVTARPGEPVELQPGDTVMLAPDSTVTVTPVPDGEDLTLETPEGTIELTGFFAEAPEGVEPTAIGYRGSSGQFNLMTSETSFSGQSITAASNEGYSLPEAAALPEAFLPLDEGPRGAALRLVLSGDLLGFEERDRDGDDTNDDASSGLPGLDGAELFVGSLDQGPSIFSLSADTLVAREGETITLTVTRDGNLSGTDTIEFQTLVGGSFSASAADVVGMSGTLTFAPNETVKTVTVPLVADAPLAEATEFFGFAIGNAATSRAAGTVETDVVALTLSIRNNDAPVNAVPAPQMTNEDTPLVFSTGGGNAITVAEPDGDSVVVTLRGGNGSTLLVSGIPGGVAVSGNGTGVIVLEGSAGGITAALEGLQFRPAANFTGAASFSVLTSDGLLTDLSTVAVNVVGQNDAPVNSAPANVSVNEDSVFTFSGANTISIVDPDAGAGAIRVTLNVGVGALNLSGVAGLGASADLVGGDGTLDITGSLADINAALANMTYTPTPDSNGADVLAIFSDDLGNTGAGGNLTDTDNVIINVVAVNDPPVNTVPGGQVVVEDGSIAIAGISVVDSDAGANNIQTVLSVTNGTITVDGGAGAAVTNNGTASVTLTGTAAQISATLGAALGATYTPNADFNGNDTLTVTTNDLGNVGIPGPLTDVDPIAITVTAVNDDPVNTVPLAPLGAEIGVAQPVGAGVVQVSDVDAAEGTGILSVTLVSRDSTTALNGALTLGSTAGLTGVVGNGTNTLSFDGLQADINAALNTLSFLEDATADTFTITLTTNDNGNFPGPAGMDVDTFDIGVSARPVNSVPGLQTTAEDTPVTFNVANTNLISISDADDPGGNTVNMGMRVTVTGGTFSLNPGAVGALTFTNGANNSAMMSFEGTINEINAALDGGQFVPTADFFGPASVRFETGDLGAPGGVPGGLTDDDTVNVTVNAVADTPSVTNATTDEDVQSTTGLVVSRNVADGAEVTHFQITNIQNGTLFQNDGTTAINAGDFITFAQANAGLRFTPTADFFGTGSFDVQASTSNVVGGLGGGVVTANVTVNAVADTPSVTNATTDEDVQSTAGLVVSRNVADGAEVTHFQITNIQNGALFQNDGTTAINDGDFITFAQANAGLRFTPAADRNTDGLGDTFTFDVQASTSNAVGGLGGGVVTATVTVDAVNDGPTNTVPVAPLGSELTVLSAVGVDVVQVTDPDALEGDGELLVTLVSRDSGAALNGALSVTTTTGLTTVTGQGTNTLTLQGSEVNLNNALDTLQFVEDVDADTFTITVTTDDRGQFGTPGAVQDVDTFDIDVSARPVNTVPGAQTVDEDTPVTFVNGTGTELSVFDADDPGGATQVLGVRLTVTGGTLTLSGTGGLTFENGTTNGSALLEFEGTANAINAALNNATFDPTADTFGAASVQIDTGDGGYVGGVLAGLQDSDTVSITVDPVADTPSVTGATTNEDVQTTTGLVVSRNVVDGAEVTHFQITNIQNGTLFQNNGTTVIGNGDFITFAQANAGLRFTPTADFFGTGSFDVQASTSNVVGGLGGGVVTANVTVNAVADTPSVTGATTNEDVQTTTGLVVSRNAADGAEVTHFQITNIQNGALFQNDGTTAISDGDFITFAQANAGLRFTPTADFFGTGSFDVQASTSNVVGGLGGGVVTANVTVNAVADTPSVTNATTDEDVQSTAGLVVSRNVADGAEVTHFQITNIQNGTLFQNDGTTAINAGDFITFAQANAGLRFTPTADFFGTGSFDVQASTSNVVGGLGGGVVTANVTVNAVADTPSVTNATTDEDVQSTAGLVVSRNVADGAEVTHFQITNIQNGALFQNDGTTAINDGDFITFAQANAGLRFTPAADRNTDGLGDTFTFDVQASTSNAVGGLGGGVVTATVTVDAVNDGPTNTVPVAPLGSELTVLSAVGVDVVQVTDPDALEGDGELLVTLVSRDSGAALNGALSVTTTTGLTTVTGQGTNTLTLQGSEVNLNNALDTLQFVEDVDADTFTITVTTDDRGQFGTPGAVQDVDTFDIDVSARPVNTVPGAQTVDEDTPVTFVNGTGTELSVFDADDPGGATQVLGVRLTVTGGTLTLSGTGGLTFENGTTNGSALLEFEGTANAINAALNNATFDPTADTFGAASVQIDTGDGGYVGGVLAGLQDSDTVSITVDPVADTPSVTGATTNEDVQTTTGLVVSRNVVDGAEVTHFQITNIQNGTLFQNNGTTVIGNGDFITFAQANAGLRFTPTADFFGTGSFDVQASTSNVVGGLGGGVVTANVTVNAVADTPSVTGATTNEDQQTTTGLVVSRNPSDGAEVTHFQITNIQNGALFQNNGTTVIGDGDFITFAQANAGLKFTPDADEHSTSGGPFSFDVQASTSNVVGGLGGGVVTANVTVNAVADTPSVTNATTDEDQQTTTGLVISRNPSDGAEVTHFQITNIQNGTLFQNNGTTVIGDGDFITFAQANAGLKFTPDADEHSTSGGPFSFDVQASTSNVVGGLGGGVVTANVTVNTIADTPSVTNATTDEDQQTTTGLVISRNPSDGAEVTHFQITNIQNGTLFQNNGTTVIGDGDFITFAQANAGLKFTPDADEHSTSGGPFSFDVQASTSNAVGGLGGGVVTADVTVNTIADTPSVTNATTDEDQQTTTGLVISRNPSDGAEVTHFQITNITNGALFQNNGTTAIGNGDFITFAQANAGLKFTPTPDFFGTGSFDVQASTSNVVGGLGGGVVTADVTVNTIADTPSVTNATTDEDVQSTTGLVVSRNVADGAEVTHFQITNIQNGTLFQNNGTTAIGNGDFITFAQANAGLKFTPAANENSDIAGGPFTFDVQASTSNVVGGLGGGVTTASITVNSVNDAPDVTAPATVGTSSSPVNLVNLIDVADIDAGNDPVSLTLTSSEGGSVITFAVTTGLTPTGNGTNSVNLVGSLTDLNNALNNNVTYAFSADSTITVTLDDQGNNGGGGPENDVEIISVNLNLAPTINNLDSDSVNYTEGDGAVVIDQPAAATVTDSDSPDFNGGQLFVDITGNEQAEDALFIRDQGAGDGNISLNVPMQQVFYDPVGAAGPTLIGTYTLGSLTVDFTTADATLAAVTALLQNITYENTNTADPSNLQRTVTFTISDGDGGTSSAVAALVNVADQNDSPDIVGAIPALNAIDDDRPAPSNGSVPAEATLVSDFVTLGGNVTDPDSGALLGIAVTGVDTALGDWYYSHNNGNTWTLMNTASDTSAVLLFADADTYVYLDPDGSPTGTVNNALTFRAWDRSGAGGSPTTENNTHNVTSNGGATAFSDETGNAAITVNATASGPVVSVDLTMLNGTNGFSMTGENSQDQAGKHVAGIGDFNGDGFADLLVTAPNVDTPTTGGGAEGRSYVILGASSHSALNDGLLNSLNGTNGGFRLDGGIAAGSAGDSGTAAGDFDGDGLDDIAMGVPLLLGVGTSETAVFFGRGGSNFATENGVNLANLDPAGGSAPENTGLVLSPTGTTKSLGLFMGGGGDFNGDGISDLVVGLSAVNQAYIVFGQNGFAANPSALTPGVSTATAIDLTGSDGNDGFVGGISYAGDVNGDGIDDVLMSAPGLFADSDGKVLLLYGRTNPATVDGLDVSGAVPTSQGAIFNGPGSVNGELGRNSVAGIGDINGDGFADIAMVAPAADPGGRTNAGSTYIVFGNGSKATLGAINLASLNGTNGFVLHGSNTNGGQTGKEMQVSAAGDVNGDGYDDFMISEPGLTGSGKVYLIYGSASGFAALNGDNLGLIIDGVIDQNGDGLADGIPITGAFTAGRGLAAAGDLNGDGYDDIAIGAFENFSPSFVVRGSVHIVYGGDFRVEGDASASAGADILVGSATGETIDGLGGADSIRTGAGDDVIHYYGTERRIDGGGDELFTNANSIGDILQLNLAADANLDLTAIADTVLTNIEAIDLRGSGSNTLTLDIRDLLNLSDTTDDLFVRGDPTANPAPNDTVDVSGEGFTMTGTLPAIGGVVYDEYTIAGVDARLLVEQGVSVLI